MFIYEFLRRYLRALPTIFKSDTVKVYFSGWIAEPSPTPAGGGENGFSN